MRGVLFLWHEVLLFAFTQGCTKYSGRAFYVLWTLVATVSLQLSLLSNGEADNRQVRKTSCHSRSQGSQQDVLGHIAKSHSGVAKQEMQHPS